MKSIKNFLICFTIAFMLFTSISQAQWSLTNGPYGTVVTSFAVTQNSEGGKSIFAGTVNGIYRSTNEGGSWIPANNGLPSDEVTSLISYLSSSGEQYIFSGTFRYGIFLSTDYGANWTPVNNGLFGLSVSSLAVNSNYSGGNLIVAGTSGGGVYISTNNGSEWKAINHGLTSTEITSVATGLNSEGTICIFAASEKGNIFRTNNNGLYWEEIYTGVNFKRGGISLALKPNKTSGFSILAGYFNGGLFISTNDGNDWEEIDRGLPGSPNFFINSVAMNPTQDEGNEIIINLGGTGSGFETYYSNDYGLHWNLINGLPNTYTGAFLFTSSLTGANEIFAATTIGVYLSTNSLAGWNPVNTGIRSPILSMAVSPNESGANDIAVTTIEGIFLSTNNGDTWNPINNGLTAPYNISPFVALGPNGKGGNNIFAATYDGKLFVSTDKGADWEPVNFGSFNYISLHFLKSIYNSSSGNNIYAATNLGIFLTTDFGQNWSKINSGVPNEIISSAIAVSNGTNGTFIFEATYDNGIFRSNDFGQNWSKSGLTNNDTGPLISYDDKIIALNSSDIFLSTDFGLTWNSIKNGLSTNSFSSVIASPANAGGNNIFLGTYDRGIFLSTNDGSNWKAINDGLKTLSISNFGCGTSASGGKIIFAGTYSGLYRRQVSDVTAIDNSSNSLPSSFKLEQNYPNPFNPTTVISYKLPKSAFVQIKVYDMLGRQVAVLVDEQKSAGDYKVNFNANNLASGVYIYRLRAGDYSETKKMVLLR